MVRAREIQNEKASEGELRYAHVNEMSTCVEKEACPDRPEHQLHRPPSLLPAHARERFVCSRFTVGSRCASLLLLLLLILLVRDFYYYFYCNYDYLYFY